MEIKVIGADKLEKKLKDLASMEKVKNAVRLNGSELQQGAMQYAPVKTGNLKQSIRLQIRDSGMEAAVHPIADYAEYVEFGTRFMEAQPYLLPAFEVQLQIFRADLKRALED